jgi:hypothetical protein
MVEPDPVGRDLTRTRARRRLEPGAACVLCGERDSETLAERSIAASVLEVHHVVGGANDEALTVVLCLNCHRRISARMPTAGIDLKGPGDRSSLERLVSVLRGLAVFFEQLAHALMVWAHELTMAIAADLADGEAS